MSLFFCIFTKEKNIHIRRLCFCTNCHNRVEMKQEILILLFWQFTMNSTTFSKLSVFVCSPLENTYCIFFVDLWGRFGLLFIFKRMELSWESFTTPLQGHQAYLNKWKLFSRKLSYYLFSYHCDVVFWSGLSCLCSSCGEKFSVFFLLWL